MSQIERVYGKRGETAALRDLRIAVGYKEAADRASADQKQLAVESLARLSMLPGGDVVDLLLRMRAGGLQPMKPEIEYQARTPELRGRHKGT